MPSTTASTSSPAFGTSRSTPNYGSVLAGFRPSSRIRRIERAIAIVTPTRRFAHRRADFVAALRSAQTGSPLP
jgi:hypothetical protein